MIKLVHMILVSLLFTGAGLSQELHILYTQNTNGILRNCQCPDHPLGGMEKRATFVADWLQQHPNTLLFDSGDFLSFEGYPETDAHMLQAMAALPYTAVNLGDQEFSNGFNFIQSAFKTGKLPWVASNLLVLDSLAFTIPQQRIVEQSGLRLLVMGVLDEASFQFFKKMDVTCPLAVTDPEKAVTEIYREISSASRIDDVILLSNLGYDRDRVLAEKLSFLDIIIGGHSQHQFEQPVVIGQTIITQCGKNGQYLGHLELHYKNHELQVHSGELIPMDLSIKDDEAMLKLISD